MHVLHGRQELKDSEDVEMKDADGEKEKGKGKAKQTFPIKRAAVVVGEEEEEVRDGWDTDGGWGIDRREKRNRDKKRVRFAD